MTNRKYIPKQLKTPLEHKQFSYQYYWNTDNKISLHSYVVCSKSKGIEEYSAAEFPASNTGHNKGRWQMQASTFEIL